MARERFDPLAPDPAGLAAAVAVLRRGGVVAYPTDTLYGLAVDPRNDEAVERLFAVKGRGAASAIALIAADATMAEQVAAEGFATARAAARGGVLAGAVDDGRAGRARTWRPR